MRRSRSSPVASFAARAAAAVSLAAGLVLSASSGSAEDKVKPDDDLNYQVLVPGTWEWGNPADYDKYGVKVRAERLLKEVVSPKDKPEGQGARMLLSVQDVPASLDPDYETWVKDWQQGTAEIERLDALAQDPGEPLKKSVDELAERIATALASLVALPDVQALLLHRYAAAEQSKATSDGRASVSGKPGIPAGEVDIEAPSPNLSGVPQKSIGRMLVFVIRKKMYRLAMWRWPTARDGEHLRDDCDAIEFGYVVPKKEAIGRKVDPKDPAAAGSPGGKGAGGSEAPRGNSGEKLTLKDLAFGYQILKPVGFVTKPIDRTKPENMYSAFAIESIATREGDSAVVDCLIYRAGSGTSFSSDNHFVQAWEGFLKTHPAGTLQTARFVPVALKTPFLSLPDLAKPDTLKRPGNPEDPTSRSELERLGVVTEAKSAAVGKEKVRNAWRFCMIGVAERVGTEVQVNYVWANPKRSYLLRVTTRRDGLKIWAADLKAILASFEMVE